MPILNCRCGNRIDLSAIPNPVGYRLITEAATEGFIERVVQLAATTQDVGELARLLTREFHRNAVGRHHVYECTQCRRVIVFRTASDNIPAFWLVPDGTQDGSLGSHLRDPAT